MKKILVLGASGQIGTDLTLELGNRFGDANVVASDMKIATDEVMDRFTFEFIDVLNKHKLEELIERHGITEIYHLAALLSGRSEQKPMFAWDVNMRGLFNVMELVRDKGIERMFWPSSIAVFGPSTPKHMTPQKTIMEPNTVYGISKLAGERWIEYFNVHYGTDIRSVRYPGIISYKTEAGGGTTDYAVEIFFEAVRNGHYDCYLRPDTLLPMMYMEDAIRLTIDIMDRPKAELTVNSSYNVAAMSFTPEQLAEEIRKHLPHFTIRYQPDFRQAIADSWPASIDDSVARQRRGWHHEFDMPRMVEIMIREVAQKLEREKTD